MRSNTEILVEAVYYKVAAQLLQDNLDIENFLNNLEYLKQLTNYFLVAQLYPKNFFQSLVVILPLYNLTTIKPLQI